MGLGAARDTDREILIRLEGKMDLMMLRHQAQETDIAGLKMDVRKLNDERQQRVGMIMFVRTLYGLGGIAIGVIIALMVKIQH